ncbi:hypothetical protein [Pectinatus frisingensis]|uniref:hypothetical protein n=1 Tax=Pectinatus frisingensis TaxID=865 RepID=UPI0018C802E4|nr:hypothetical protein [Pectinatus frisingensis]
MNQAEITQFNFDLQLFAEQPETDSAPDVPNDSQEPESEPSVEPEQNDEPEPKDTATNTDSNPDYSKLGNMDAAGQFDYLKKHGIFGKSEQNKEPDNNPDNKQDKPDQADKQSDESKEEPAKDGKQEPLFEITVNGQKQKVTQSELIAGFQRNADYTQKTQALADERRKVEALAAAFQVQHQINPQQHKPVQAAQTEYQAAVAETERQLGIKPGTFNPYNPMHTFTLNKVTTAGNMRVLRQQSLNNEIQEFARAAKADPMTPKIDAAYDKYLFQLGSESPEGAQKAQAVFAAKQRFFAHQANKADTDLLKAHWEFVKNALSTPTQTKPKEVTITKPQVEPPKTEVPGKGKRTEPKFKMDYKKFRGGTPQEQHEMLKKAGFFERKEE